MIPIPTGEKMCKKKSLTKMTFLSVPSNKGDIEVGKKITISLIQNLNNL